MTTGPQVLGKYELHERLGRGGMAEVWKGFDTQLQRYVAIKFLHPDLQADAGFMARFEQEARVIASLHHPNIVQLYDYHVSTSSESKQPNAYMVMAYIEGQTLAQYIAQTSRSGQIPPAAEIVHLFTALSSAIDYAHGRRMIHCDLKPANILLDLRNTTRHPMGEPLLSDFGIAKLLGTSMGTYGSQFGTPSYVSPEQILGVSGNELSDLYSLGVILYELCTGRPPFQGSSPVAIMMQHLNAIPVPPILLNPALPPAVSAVILRSLEKDPGARFPSASALTAALAQTFSLPIPQELQHATEGLDLMGEPTYSRLLHAPSYLQMAPSSPTPVLTGPLLSSPSRPLPPPQVSTYATNGLSSSTMAPQKAPPTGQSLFPSPPPGQARRRRGVLIAAVLLLILFGAGTVAFALLTHRASTVSAGSVRAIVGHAFFLNTNQLDPTNSQGVNDQVQLDLTSVPPPASGNSYYAWLLSDKNQPDARPILLGKLSVQQGHVHLLYTDTQQHANLLAVTSRLLITEEPADVTPLSPSPDQSTWRYYAELAQAPNPQDTTWHSSSLTHLRHLLARDPRIQALGLSGGTASWMLRNTAKTLEWTNSARDDWGNSSELNFMRRQFVRTLAYVDGASVVQRDLPAGTPLYLNDPRVVSVGLLGTDLSDKQHPNTYRSYARNMGQPVVSGYLYDVASHLDATIWSPGATSDQQELGSHINIGLNYMRMHLEQVRGDAMQLLSMTNNQLLQPSALAILNDMATQANAAYVGQYDPATKIEQPGVVQIYRDIQALATLPVRPYTAS